MRITILCVGKIKEKYLQMGIAEYTKRLSKYGKLDILEVPDEKTPDRASEAEEAMIRKIEGDRLLKHIKPEDFVVTMAIDGQMTDSVSLSRQIENWGIQGISHIVFVIGGSLGLSPEVLARGNYSLSFSKLTFPHQLMRLILLEQIYRSYRIMRGEPYHK